MNGDLVSLRRLALFEGLSDSCLERIRPLLHYQEMPAGREFIQMGERSGKIHHVESGSVKVFTRRGNRPDHIMTLLGPGELLGDISAMDGGSHTASVITLEPCLCNYMTVADFEFCRDEIPGVERNLTKIMAKRMRRLTDQSDARNYLDATGRLLWQLLQFAKDYGVPERNGSTLIPISTRQRDLAGLIGTRRETVNRIVRESKKQKQLAMCDRHRFRVLDWPALEKRCSLLAVDNLSLDPAISKPRKKGAKECTNYCALPKQPLQ